MPKRRREPEVEDTYGEVYGNVYGKTKKKGRHRNKDIYGETTTERDKTSDSTPAQPRSTAKILAVGISLVTISGFMAAFFMISQLWDEIAKLQNKETTPQPTAGTTSTTALTQPPPFTETLGTTQRLPEVSDERLSTALKQLNEADRSIRSAFEKMSGDFKSLQEWTQQSISQAEKKINNDLCGLEELLEQWTVPTDTLGALLSVEGWTKANERLYYKVFKHHRKSYAEAKIECNKLGSRLVSASLQYMAAKRVIVENIWIGYDDIQREGIWTWSDGSQTFYPARLQWIPNQPDNTRGVEDCAYIVRLTNGKYMLNDYTCETEQHYICEKDSTPSTADDSC